MADNLARQLAIETARAGLSMKFLLGRINFDRCYFYRLADGDKPGSNAAKKLERGIALAREVQQVIAKNTGENHVAY